MVHVILFPRDVMDMMTVKMALTKLDVSKKPVVVCICCLHIFNFSNISPLNYITKL